MPLNVPNLDDRNFEQLLDESKRRIPVHTPEWTNFNEADPGLTIVELFAFLTESLLYRANRIPERSRLKFLELLGIGLRPASAAQGILRFSATAPTITTLAAGQVVQAGKVPFVTLDGLDVLPLEAKVYTKKPITDPERIAEYQALYETFPQPQGFYETTPMPEDGSTIDLAAQTLDGTLWIALLAPPRTNVDGVRTLVAGRTLSVGVVPVPDEATKTLHPISYLAASQTDASRLLFEAATDQFASTSDGINVPRYERLTTRASVDAVVEPGIVEATLPATLALWPLTDPFDAGAGEFPPRIDDPAIDVRVVTWLRVRTASGDGVFRWIGVNAARIRQSVPVLQEAAGRGTGEPDQTVTLANTPVLPDTLTLEVESATPGIWDAWKPTDDLFAATRDAAVYTLDPESGVVTFGDGLRGTRPAPGRRIRATYEFGGGRAGNVAAGGVNKLVSSAAVAGLKVDNPVPTWGGDDGETSAEAEKSIPAFLRHRDRLVTASDFVEIARATPGVSMGRAEALPLFRPDQPTVETPGVVTVLVIPRFDAVQPAAPVPDSLFLDRVCAHLSPRRLLTTEIHVRGPEYVPVYASIGIHVRAGRARAVVERGVRDAITSYLSPLFGGPDGTGWPLGRPVVANELEAVATRVDGVDYVEGNLLLGTPTALGVPSIPIRGRQIPHLVALGVGPEPEPLADLLGQTPPPDEATRRAVVTVPVVPKSC